MFSFSIIVNIFVFTVYIATMLLSILGNIVGIYIFTFSKHRRHWVQNNCTNQLIKQKTTNMYGKSSTLNKFDKIHKSFPINNSSLSNVMIYTITLKPNPKYRKTLNPASSFNYYLASLAISDFFMSLFCIPFTFTQIYLGYWPFHYLLCPIVTYAQLVMVTASAFTNTVISLDRLIGILTPMSPNKRSRQYFYTIGILICIWLVSIGGSTVQLIIAKTTVVQQTNSTVLCQESWNGNEFKRSIYTLALFLVIYLIPLVIQSLTYGFIGFKLWNRQTPGEQIKVHEHLRTKEKRRVCLKLIYLIIN